LDSCLCSHFVETIPPEKPFLIDHRETIFK